MSTVDFKSIHERFVFEKVNFEKQLADDNQKHE